MATPFDQQDAGSIGERIRAARKDSGLSQADLAQRIGVSQPAIAAWESGVHDPRRVVMARLADALGVSLEWLAAGARSAMERDPQAAAAYLRRPLRHVPVISGRSAARFARDMKADPHAMAEDYIPVTAGSAKLFALFLDDKAVDLAFPTGSLVVIDYDDRAPGDGTFCLAAVDDALVVRRWRRNPDRLEAVSTDPDFRPRPIDASVRIIGCVRVSIRFH